MKKIIPILLVSAAAVAAAAWQYRAATVAGDFGSRICFDQKCYAVEIASTPEARDAGLMYRKELGKDRGMLFVFEQEGPYRFWMKNTLIPLDIVWIGSDNRIVYISENTPPCAADPCANYGPAMPAKYVLEINAGQVAAIGAKVGDKVKINY